MTHEDMIAVIAAHRDGVAVERRATDQGMALFRILLAEWFSEPAMRQWHAYHGGYSEPLNFSYWEYRIVTPYQPKAREWLIGENVLRTYSCNVPGNIHVREVLPSSGEGAGQWE